MANESDPSKAYYTGGTARSDQAMLALAAAGSGGMVVSADDPLVFWGYTSGTGGSRQAGDRAGLEGGSESGPGGTRPSWDRMGFADSPPRGSGETDRPITSSQAMQEFYNWDEKERKRWVEYLLKLGLISEDQADDFGVLRDWWKEAVAEAANFYQNGSGKKLDPWQTLRFMYGNDEAVARRKKALADNLPFTGTKVIPRSSVDLTDPTQAKGLINDVLSQMLGRAANPEELSQFTATLNAAERANPEVTTTSTTYDAGEPVSSSTVSTGGLDRRQVMIDRAQSLPDYGAYQAATTYADALFRAIQSPVNV